MSSLLKIKNNFIQNGFTLILRCERIIKMLSNRLPSPFWQLIHKKSLGQQTREYRNAMEYKNVYFNDYEYFVDIKSVIKSQSYI